MDSFFARYRNLIVLLVLLLGQIIGLAVQVHRTASGGTAEAKDGPGVRLIRIWAENLVAPAERGIEFSRVGVFGLWQNYLDLRNVRQQNQDLQGTIDRLRLEQASLLEDAKQGQRLQAALGFQHSYIYSTVLAQAIGTSGSDRSRVFYLDKGSDAGLKPDMAVITAEGIVGKVRDVGPHSAQVLAINDQSAGAGVILEKTRIRGILRGNAAGQLVIVGVMNDTRIQPGERILTAGGDLVYPRGLTVGYVKKVVNDPDRDSFVLIYVTPSAQLDRIDEVLVVTEMQSHFNDQQQQDIAASQSLKSGDLTVLQQQKKASAIMAERLPGLTDPNLPAPQPAPSNGTQPAGTPPVIPTLPQAPAPHTPTAIHPDRFTPPAVVKPSTNDSNGRNQ